MSAFNVRKLPKSLKDTLKSAGKQFGENLNPYLLESSMDGETAVLLDYYLAINASMFDVPVTTSKASQLKATNTSGFESLATKVGIHLFGDNVSEFKKVHEADKGDGHWEIVISDFKDDDSWLVPVVYLVPHGIAL